MFINYKKQIFTMKKVLASLSVIVGLAMPSSANALMGIGTCLKRVPLTVEVSRGDTLMDLTEKVYGVKSKYLIVARHNELENPDFLRVGHVIEFPERYMYVTRIVSILSPSIGGYCSI